MRPIPKRSIFVYGGRPSGAPFSSAKAILSSTPTRRAGVSAQEIAVLDEQTRRALALLLRQQFRPGPRHLFKSPEDVEGAMPGSEVDWELRIDYTQHTGSALVRWLDLTEAAERAEADDAP
jgi:hypothetical protein